MTKPGGRRPLGERGMEGETRSRPSRRRVRRGAATERREGEVRRFCDERRPHRSDRAETGRRERSGVFGTKPKTTRREPRQDADKTERHDAAYRS